MRSYLVGEAKCLERTVEYYLLAESMEETGGEVYGVGVKFDGESEEIPGITISQRRVQALLEALIQGGVTPVTARDVVEDWLLE